MADKRLTPRHVRHRKRSRLRRSKDFKSFLSGLQAVLNATGATVTPFVSAAVNAVGTLTASAVANADTVTINGRVYTFQTALTNVNNNVKSTGVLATDLANLAKAINLTGVAGTDYAAAQTINADVSATSDATHVVVTAKTAGTAQNAFATTKVGAGLAWGGATLASGTAASANLTKATHGKVIGEGPFLASNAGGALPTPLSTTQLYWVVAVPDVNTFGLASAKRGAAAIVLTSAGSGTNTLTKASSLEAIFQYLKRRGGKQMKAATDVDFL